MVIVLSKNKRVIELSKDIAGDRKGVKELDGIQQLDSKNISDVDIVLVDLKEYEESELPEIQFPAIILVSIPEYGQAMRLLQAGYRGYGNRHMLKENLVQAVEAVKSGQVWLPPAIIHQMITSLPGTQVQQDETPLKEPLSKREREVVEHVTEGLANSEIADKMFISIRTVKAHLTSIFKKTECRDRLELALKMKKT